MGARAAAAVFLASTTLGCPFAMDDDFAVDPTVDDGAEPVPKDASCTDGARNGAETDVDCGGAGCSPCGDDRGCALAADCTSGVCESGTCRKSSCTDGVRNGDESDTDCGGHCPRCPLGGTCAVSEDCELAVCATGTCVSLCADGVKDADETDVDCGGPTCGVCPLGSKCKDNGDCESDHCSDHTCST